MLYNDSGCSVVRRVKYVAVKDLLVFFSWFMVRISICVGAGYYPCMFAFIQICNSKDVERPVKRKNNL